MNSFILLAVLSLGHIFSNHAVLQQEAAVPVWGWGDPGQKVEVVWDGAKYKTTVQADGSWRVVLQTGKADGKARTLTVKSGKESLTRTDMVLGEVWLCSGQSNMEMPLAGFGNQNVEGGTDAIMTSPETASSVRVFAIKTPRCQEPIPDVDAVWEYSTPEVACWTSAIAYFFGRRLSRTLDVPVGLVVNPWGGSRIECWMTREAIDGAGLTQEELAHVYSIEENQSWPTTPELIWNGRVKPIAGYAAKGIIWYQGCSNVDQPHCYHKLQKAMVELWRREWGRNLPFIFTLLAPYDHGNPDGRWVPFFVENQLLTEQVLTDSWAVCAETLGNKATIHPPKKREIADMMVQRALQNVYGINPGVALELPRLQKVEYLPDGTAKITLTQVWGNLMTMSAPEVTGFDMAGEDRVFYPAEARVDTDGQTIIVTCPQVKAPASVRYGWRNWTEANLQKSNGIPVPPFRTDNWDY